VPISAWGEIEETVVVAGHEGQEGQEAVRN
jgi:hypothetical protein